MTTPITPAPTGISAGERICVYILVAGLIFGLGWALERSHQTNLELSREISQLQSDQKSRDADLKVQLAQIAAAQSAVRTPAQAAAAIPKALPVSVPQPIQINIPPATPSNPVPDAIATIPQVDLKPLFDSLLACKAAELQVPTLQADLADEKKINAAIKKQNSRGKKILNAAKWVGIGAAVGAIAMLASGH